MKPKIENDDLGDVHERIITERVMVVARNNYDCGKVHGTTEGLVLGNLPVHVFFSTSTKQ